MPGLPNVPGVIRVDHRFTVGNDQNVNSSLRFKYTGGPPTTAQLNALAASINAAFNTNMLALLATGNTLNEVWVQDLADMTKPIGVDATVRTGSAGGALPASICMVTGYKIARRYRGGHPRGYWPFGWAGSPTNGVANWAGTFVTQVQNAINAYITAIKALTSGGIVITGQASVGYYGGAPVSYTRPNGQTAYRPALLGTPHVDDVFQIVANTRMGSQRRRLRKA